MRARQDGQLGGLGEGGRPRAVVDAVEPDRELVRLRAENLALKGEPIGLRLAADRGPPREPGGAEAGLSDLAGELRRMALRSERLVEAVRERDGRLAEMSRRVKNGLLLVTGLLRGEAERQRNPQARAALGRAGARVEAVGGVGGVGWGGGGSGTVAVDRYLRETC